MAAPILLPLAVLALVAAASGGKKRGRRQVCPEGFTEMSDGTCEITFEDWEEIHGGNGGADGGYGPVAGQGTFRSYAELPQATREGQAMIRWMAEALGLDPAWSVFFEATALNESGFNPLRGLGKPSLFPPWAQPSKGASVFSQNNEAKAAVTAYNRNKKTLQKCPWPKTRYTFGSGGLFGILPPNGVMQFRGTEVICIDPWSVFDWGPSLVMAIEMARGLMRRSNFKKLPVYGNLRIGWGVPSKMSNPTAVQNGRTKDRRYADRLSELGYSPTLWDEPVQPLPPEDPVGMLNYLDSII